ncbi:hypothetical protein [Dolichospermum circinale]|uniref:hypothetical protein n=1 Tax=Dolichospermum circinale TaxID=109265 RepID=UPI0004218309|nr:hypothetical protein [Dolichospermum circinale]MDB9476486.1 hypothetical protein [Dolichospermum circinale CS-537/11]MDB9480930.1 hypothetical protein [Dolichospermum circinale CS-537/03]
MQKLPTLSGVLLLAFAPLISNIHPVIAQQNFANCQQPNVGEYLLLVLSPTPENQKQLRAALPTEQKTIVCKDNNQIVTRVGGFTNIDDAKRWARYIQNIVGLSATITTRVTEPATQLPQTIPNIQTPKITYNPKILGEGYAILVDYFNRPEMVSSLRKAVGGDVGFVSYGQRPYLLAVYTTNQKEAYNTLKKLSETGFVAILADGRKVVLLRSIVR